MRSAVSLGSVREVTSNMRLSWYFWRLHWRKRPKINVLRSESPLGMQCNLPGAKWSSILLFCVNMHVRGNPVMYMGRHQRPKCWCSWLKGKVVTNDKDKKINVLLFTNGLYVHAYLRRFMYITSFSITLDYLFIFRMYINTNELKI